jgi:Lamin Tail Domain
MKPGISTSRNLCIVLAAVVVFALPAAARAQVHITEVMYDAAGSDQGHEWVEVAADSAVDLSGWRFTVAGDNHLLSVVEGTTSLTAGTIAILSNDPQTFLTDYPTYTGTLFKSSFSLTNTGGTIALKDKKLNVVDSVTYASSNGAAGDGNSLHITNGTLVASAPNPGSLAATRAIVLPPKVSATTAKKSTSKSTKSTSAKSSSATYKTGNQAAALPLSLPSLPSLPTLSASWLYGLGLVALLVLGAGAALYAKPDQKVAATNLGAEEFDIE